MELMNMRKAFGQTLLELGQEDERVVALEADLGRSTMSNMFGAAFPERYYEMGIAEANMMSVAAGLALTGQIPFVNSFAVFASGRAYDQIRSSVCIPKLKVNICGSSAGLSDFGDGKTHQSIDDIAIMRVLPNMRVLSPMDGKETEDMVRAMAALPGPCYLRLNRNDVPVLDALEPFEADKVRLMKNGDTAVVFATGYMVHLALEAAKALETQGIDVSVVNVHTIKPLDVEGVLRHIKGKRAVLTIEEASVIGGLGSAICEVVAEARLIKPPAVLRMGMQDEFGTSAADYHELLAHYGLTAGDIVQNIQKALAE